MVNVERIKVGKRQSIDGNVTLSGLSYGEHTVVAYATDSEGNTGISETINFVVKAPEPPPPVIPTVAIVAVPVAIVAFTIGTLVFYRRKVKH